MSRKKSGMIVIGILICITIGVLYVTHRAVPFMMDDIWYSTKLSSDAPITSLWDIVESQVWHYFHWGGRSITHAILQMTLLAGEWAADILNVIVTLLLAFMICIVSGNRKAWGFFAGLGMLAGLNANWKMSMFWQAGAANYLYITVFILLFLWCYLREPVVNQGLGETVSKKKLPGITLWIVPLGIMAGWSNENMGPTAWILSAVVIGMVLFQKQKIKLWMILGNVSCLIGSIMVVAAPGNFVRVQEAAQNEYGALWTLFLRCYAESKAALEYLFPAVLLSALLLVISKGILKIPIGRKNILLMLGALLSWGAMVLSPHYPDRATFGTMVLLICVIVSLMKEIYNKQPETGTWLLGISAIVWLRGMYFMGEFLAISWGWIK